MSRVGGWVEIWCLSQGSGSGVWIELWGSPTTPAEVSRRWMEYEDRRAMHSSRALWQMAQLRLGPKASRLPPNNPAPQVA